MADPRLDDWHYAELAEAEQEPDHGDDWSLADLAEGRSDEECMEAAVELVAQADVELV